MKKILVIGNWKTIHITRFLQILTQNTGDALIVDAYDPCYENGQDNSCGVNRVYRINISNIEKTIFGVRKVGTYLLQKKKIGTLKNILRDNQYDLVNVHFLPTNVLDIVKACKQYNTKVMLTPLGSDVLRVKKIYLNSLKRAFLLADYVSFNISTGFCKEVSIKYDIPLCKIVNLGYGSETISSILNLKREYNKIELSQMLSLPYSKYNIVCGYNASVAQRQDVIFRSLIENRHFLPEGYQIIFPLSYGNDKDYIKNTIIELNKKYNLNIFFLETYLTTEQVAAFRIVSDLFIHIQTTDAYNASLQEFLLSGTQIINGKWLKYPDLEAYGMPYYICETLDCLPMLMSNVLRNYESKIPVSAKVFDIIKDNAWSEKIVHWVTFFRHI